MLVVRPGGALTVTDSDASLSLHPHDASATRNHWRAFVLK